MPWMRHDWIWRSFVLAIVVVLHVCVGWALMSAQVSRAYDEFHARATEPETILVLTFETREDKKKDDSPPTSRRTNTPPARMAAEVLPAGSSVANEPSRSSTPGQEPLELSLAPSMPTNSFRRDFLEHRAAIEYTGTRYDRAWMSDGNLVDVAAKRSVVAGVLLGALGALKKPCTDRQRRRYEVECVPDQYIYQEGGEP